MHSKPFHELKNLGSKKKKKKKKNHIPIADLSLLPFLLHFPRVLPPKEGKIEKKGASLNQISSNSFRLLERSESGAQLFVPLLIAWLS